MIQQTKLFLDKNIEDFTKDNVKTLGEIITYHSDLYYNKEEPIISDYEYDMLFKKLQELEKKFDVEQMSLKVGADVIESSFKKVLHSRPMISLDNTYNEEDLNDFDERVRKNIGNDDMSFSYTIEFKFDGLGVELIYKGGKLVQAITRGNGVEGEDVTENIKQISNIPQTISYTDHLEVRGEVVMPLSAFEEINKKALKEGTKVFSNPRNAASGSVRMKDNRVTKERKLKFFAYDLANFDEFVEKEQRETYFDTIKDLELLGFDISSYFIKCPAIQDVIKTIDNFGDTKSKIDFEIDGLVLKVDDISLWKTIGSTEHHPKYAIAYKFPAEILTTRIESVEHSVGRTGTITPVANLEPLHIGGVIVRRATLHNYEEVENLDVRIGDSVFIKRAGEVIPKIISVVKEEGRDGRALITPPTTCPSCSEAVYKDEDKVRFYCANFTACPAQVSEQLIWSVGKQAFNIDGLGEKQVELFLKEGIITNLVSVFHIDTQAERILGLEGFKEKSVNNLISAIDAAKKTTIVTLLVALGISGVGKKTAKILSKLFTSSDDLLNFSYTGEELQDLDDIGPEIATNIVEYFTNEVNKNQLQELVSILTIDFLNDSGNTAGKYSGVKMCITGSFEGYSRDQLVEILEKEGGEFMSSVSKKTDALLAGEKAGSKLKKATDLGVKVLSLEEFLL